MKLLIRSGARLDQGTFDHCASWQESDADVLTVDLRRCVFADAYALVFLLTIMTLWRLDGGEVRLRLPERRATQSYFARMRFFDLLPEGVTCREPIPSVSEHPSMLVELQPVNVNEGERGIEKLGKFIYFQLPEHHREGFTIALAEVGSNVIQHSGAEVGFLAGQRYEKALYNRPPPRVQLVIADAGIGIRESLAQGVPEAGDMREENAIHLALGRGVSGKPETNSGVGLTTVREFADRYGGILRVRSGRGLMVFRNGKEELSEVPGLQGTIVAVELASPGKRT